MHVVSILVLPQISCPPAFNHPPDHISPVIAKRGEKPRAWVRAVTSIPGVNWPPRERPLPGISEIGNDRARPGWRIHTCPLSTPTPSISLEPGPH